MSFLLKLLYIDPLLDNLILNLSVPHAHLHPGSSQLSDSTVWTVFISSIPMNRHFKYITQSIIAVLHCFYQRKRPRDMYLVLQNLAKMASMFHIFIRLHQSYTFVFIYYLCIIFQIIFKVSDFTYILKLTQIKCSKYLTQFLHYLQTKI